MPMISLPKFCVSMTTVLMLTAACEQELYEKGDSSMSYMRADFVEAFVGSGKQVDYVITDDGDSLQLTAPYKGSWVERADTLYRALMYYNQRGTTAEISSMYRVPVLSAKRDVIGINKAKTDPVGLETIWMSRSKRYLNLGLLLKTGEAEAEKPRAQSFGIVKDGTALNDDRTLTLNLTLSHNQGDIPQYYTQRSYLSIAVSELKVDSLRLTLHTYDGVVSRVFSLR